VHILARGPHGGLKRFHPPPCPTGEESDDESLGGPKQWGAKGPPLRGFWREDETTSPSTNSTRSVSYLRAPRSRNGLEKLQTSRGPTLGTPVSACWKPVVHVWGRESPRHRSVGDLRVGFFRISSGLDFRRSFPPPPPPPPLSTAHFAPLTFKVISLGFFCDRMANLFIFYPAIPIGSFLARIIAALLFSACGVAE